MLSSVNPLPTLFKISSLVFTFTLLLAKNPLPAAAEIGAVNLVSYGTSAHVAALGDSHIDDITPDGRYVVITSSAPNLILNDNNSSDDVFVIDRSNGSIERVSVASDGSQGNRGSLGGKISDDGRYVVFLSGSSNFFSNDTNAAYDLFLRDRTSHQTTRLSVATDGTTSLDQTISYYAISGNGKYLVFSTSASNLISGGNASSQVYRRDLSGSAADVLRISNIDQSSNAGNGTSLDPDVDYDGNHIVFNSSSDDLVSGGTASGRMHIYRRTVDSNTTTLVDRADGAAGAEGGAGASYPSISNDGRFIAYASNATNLVSGDTNSAQDIFVRDMDNSLTTRVSVATGGAQVFGASSIPSISPDGYYVAFSSLATTLVSGDTNGLADIFLHNRNSGTTSRISLSSSGGQNSASSSVGTPSLSQAGRYVLFQTKGRNFPPGDDRSFLDVYVRDTQENTTTWLTQVAPTLAASGFSESPTISSDGNLIAYTSNATNITENDSGLMQVYFKNRSSGETICISDRFDAESSNARISANGMFVAFLSLSNGLVSGDTNGTSDIFLYDISTQDITRVSVTTSGTQANSYSEDPTISATGRYIGFQSVATNFASTDGTQHAYVHDKDAHTTRLVSVASDGTTIGNDSSYSPQVSSDGSEAIFVSDADNLVAGDSNSAKDLFVKNLVTNSLERLSATMNGGEIASGVTGELAISPDARYVAFGTADSSMGITDTNSSSDIFLLDRQTHSVLCLSKTSGGTTGNDRSLAPAFSTDGKYVLFTSYASDLVSGDTNSHSDIFSYSIQDQSLERVSVGEGGTQGNGDATVAAASDNRAQIAYQSIANNLVANDTNGMDNILLGLYDFCLEDPAKLEPGICGCNVPDTDSDGDGTPDCNDLCPNDAARTNDVDSDSDGVINCNEQCPFDSAKLTPGTCGCGAPDTDIDGDGIINCLDGCPDDPAKQSPGVCGCGVPDLDLNKNKQADCLDPSKKLVPAKPVVKVKKKTATITLQRFTKVQYEISLAKGKAKASKKKYTKNVVQLKSMKSASYKINYRIIAGKTTTKTSKTVSFKIK